MKFEGARRVLPLHWLKKFVFRHTGLGRPRYQFNIEPIQLATLIFEIERLKDTPGSIVEIGVARGMTTRFVCEHLVKQGYKSQKLYAIDTFQSFLEKDIDYEVTQRGETRGPELKGMFAYNDFDTWKRNFSEFAFVTVIQSDCAAFDYATIAPIKLVFLDVDLYVPNSSALPKIYEQLCAGGIIMVDDVQGDYGARQAYMEFCERLKIPSAVVGGKCGIIRK